MPSISTCTNHCGACGRHFHSLESFDFHRQGDYRSSDPELGRHCVHPLDCHHLDVLNADGECRMYNDIQYGVTIWSSTRRQGALAAHHHPERAESLVQAV